MIDTKALRSKVLDLAIQGKLTQQLESDGTAEELFAQIQEEKQKLIKDGKIKKEKALPPVSDDEIPFEIPSSWMWIKHNDLFEISGGSQPPKSNFISYFKDGYIRLYQIRDYGKNPVPVFIPIEKATKVTKKGDILLARYGASLGKVFWAEDGAYNVAMAKVIPLFDINLINMNFVFWYYHSSIYKDIIFGNSRSAQDGFNKDDLKNLIFPLPPFNEQKRIVEKVESIFRLLDIIDEAQKKYSADAEILKSKLISMGIQGKLTQQLDSDGTAQELFEQIQEEKQKLIKEKKIKKEKPLPPVSAEEIPFEIPENWMWCRLGELSLLITKGSSPKWQGVNYTDAENGILFVTSENVGKNKMLLEKRKYIEKHFNDSHKSSIIRKGDILTNIVGASIGRTAIFDEDIEDANINQAVCVVRLVEYSLNSYILRYMNSYSAIALMLGKIVDTARANLSLTSVSNLLIPLPPLAEQKRIAQVLDECLSIFNS